MLALTIKPVDFSTGMRAEVINDNFEFLSNEFKDERLRVGGYGIHEGMNLSIVDGRFQVHVSEGKLIDELGNKVSMDSMTVNISPVRYIVAEELLYPTDTSQCSIFLEYQPYSPQNNGYVNEGTFFDAIECGDITLTYDEYNMKVNKNDILYYQNGRIYFRDTVSGRHIHIKYFRAEPRYDILYVHRKETTQEWKIETVEHVSSSSPSFSIRGMYIVLGIVNVIPDRINRLEIVDQERTIRPVHVNKENQVYIMGSPYIANRLFVDKLPVLPKPNDVYIDGGYSYIWKKDKNSQSYSWVSLNPEMINVIHHYKVWRPEDNPKDLQRFRFDREELHLHFTPGENKIELIVDNTPIMSDQFVEHVENGVGIGFDFLQPLDKDSFVQAKVTHCPKLTPDKHRIFQKATTFISEGTINYDPYTYRSTSFQLHKNGRPVEYMTKNNQLTIYVDGKRLSIENDIIEGPEYSTRSSDPVMTNEFSIKPHVKLNYGSVITYEINRTFYSYDHVDSIIMSLENEIETAVMVSDEAKKQVVLLEEKHKSDVDRMEQSLSKAFNRIAELERKLSSAKTSSLIRSHAYPETIKITSPAIELKGSILETINDDKCVVELTRSTDNGDVLLVEHIDYSISIIPTVGAIIAIDKEIELSNDEITITVTKGDE